MFKHAFTDNISKDVCNAMNAPDGSRCVGMMLV